MYCARMWVRFMSAFTLVYRSAYSTMKLEAIRSSETSADFQRTIRRYILENSTLNKIKFELQVMDYI
jgi:hypothetical protein